MKQVGFLKDALILFVITLVAGICLGGVYEITKEPIEKAEMAALADAYRKVYAEAADFKFAPDLAEAVAASGENMAGLGFGNVQIDEVVLAVDSSGQTIGYVVTSTSKDGFNGNIKVTVGISGDGNILGIEYLTLAETPGLGMNAANPEFLEQFYGKQAKSFTVLKSGALLDGEIEALSGATITSSAVANAVNAALYFTSNSTGQ